MKISFLVYFATHYSKSCYRPLFWAPLPYIAEHDHSWAYEGLQAHRKRPSECDMPMHGWMQPIYRQAPVQCTSQIPYVHAKTRVVRGHLVRDFGKRVVELGWY